MSYTEPLITLFLVLCAVAWLRRGSDRQRRVLLGVAVFGLLLVSWPPAEWVLSRPLESRYQPFRPAARPGAIVVLGGSISPPSPSRPYPLADADTFEHCAMAVWVYQQVGPVPVLASEGAQRFSAYSTMRELLKRAGIPDDLIWTDQRSRNTHENAVFGARILREHQIGDIALVTDAQSMPRAAACFRKAGLRVTPAPCEFGELEFKNRDLLPNWRAIRRSERTLHEVLGLGWYSLRGWV